MGKCVRKWSANSGFSRCIISLLEGNYGRYIDLDKRVNLNQQSFHWQALFNRRQSTNVMNSCEIRMFDLGNLMSDAETHPHFAGWRTMLVESETDEHMLHCLSPPLKAPVMLKPNFRWFNHHSTWLTPLNTTCSMITILSRWTPNFGWNITNLGEV